MPRAAGILRPEAIESAIARPYHGYHRRIHQKAAALVHGIVDGNKRTAVYLVELMAVRSDYSLIEDDLILADVITSVATGEMRYEELVEWFKKRLVRSVRKNLRLDRIEGE